MAALTLSDASHLHALAWLTTLARAFVLPVLGSALVLIVAPRLPGWARRLAPALLRAALGLLVLAAYGPVAGELTLWGPDDSPLYRLASLVVVVCALALAIVLPLLAGGLRAPRAAPASAPLPSPTRAAATRQAPALEPLPERTPAPRSVYPSATFAAALARPPARPSPALPFVAARLVPARLVASREEDPARTLDDEEAGPPPTPAGAPRAGARERFTPPRIAPVRPEETVRVVSSRPRPASAEPLPPTHAMPAGAQARLLAAASGPRTTPLQAPLRRLVSG